MAENNNTQKKPNIIFRFFDRFGDLFVLNVLFVACSIPVITAGASFSAMLYVTNRMVMGEEGKVPELFFKGFKQNFKLATPLWIIVLAIAYGAYFCYQCSLNVADNVANIYTGLTAFLMIVLTFLLPLLFSLVARYDNTVIKTLINSFALSITHLKLWFKIFFIWIIPVIIYNLNIMIFWYTWYFWILILTAVLAFATSMLVKPLYEELEKSEEEKGDEDKDKKELKTE